MRMYREGSCRGPWDMCAGATWKGSRMLIHLLSMMGMEGMDFTVLVTGMSKHSMARYHAVMTNMEAQSMGGA